MIPNGGAKLSKFEKSGACMTALAIAWIMNVVA